MITVDYGGEFEGSYTQRLLVAFLKYQNQYLRPFLTIHTEIRENAASSSSITPAVKSARVPTPENQVSRNMISMACSASERLL
jgi:hypothetical protein